VNPVSQAVNSVKIDWDGRKVLIEYQWIGRDSSTRPLLIFLHEGLGSRSMWKDFPQRLCDASGCCGLVYSRPGHGASTPRPSGQEWEPDFMHRQAHQVLPTLLKALQINPVTQKTWLFGHSDGGSIALLYAAKFPRRIAGLIVLAPHILVEDLTIASIEKARAAYLQTDLRQRLAKYHTDPDSAFWGWNNIWLHPDFRKWSIEAEIGSIKCPLLAVQGRDDEYGSLEQIHGISRRVMQTRLFELDHCGHSPQRDQPDILINITSAFIRES